MTKEKIQPKHIIMTIDMGGSKTKIVVQEVNSESPQLFLMDSQLADIGKLSLSGIPTEGRNSDRAWVGFNKGDDSEYIYYAVGALARNRFGGIPQLHELKYELALPKILAAIWLARAEMSLPSKFNLYLSVLLPSGEISDKDILKSCLQKVIESFETPNGKMSIKIKKCEVCSEGSGIHIHRKNVLGNKFNDRNQLYVMLGFRNASAFLVRGGVPESGITSDFGMHWMLDLLATRMSGLDKNDSMTIEIIVNGMHDPELLKKLSRKRSKEDIESDFELISNAIAVSKDEYVRAVVRWLKSISGKFDEIVFCGGTAEYLRGELNKYYDGVAELIWHGDVEVPGAIESKLGGGRLADVWAFHNAFYKLIAAKINGVSKPNNSDNNNGATKSNTTFEYKRVERPAGTLPSIIKE